MSHTISILENDNPNNLAVLYHKMPHGEVCIIFRAATIYSIESNFMGLYLTDLMSNNSWGKFIQRVWR